MKLAEALSHIAQTWPAALVRQTAAQFEAGHSAISIARGLVSPSSRASFADLQTIWAKNPQWNGAAISLALLAALAAHEASQNSAPTLVWTGPEIGNGQWRRTDAALLEVIQSAQKSLWLVTFAVHGGQILQNALEAASQRNIEISFVCESPDSGKIRGDNREQVRAILPASAHFYHWPAAQRGRNANGDFGTLHAKIAVADGNLALLSSANLTDCALDFNIECGVLVRGDCAAQLARQLEELVENGVWQPL